MAEDSPSTQSDSPIVGSLDIELLIDCVKSRSLLWDLSNVEYKNRNKKKEEWAAICRVFYQAEFDEKPDVAKNKICKELQIKWKSIRDAYLRSVKMQKKKSGDAATTHKQYLYASQMEFLKSAQTHNRAEDSIAIDSPQTDVADHIEETLSESPQVSLQQTPSTSTVYRRNKKNLEENLQKYMTAITKQTEETLSHQKDDDYHFLLSILPTMKQISDNDKLKLRCDILQLIMKYKEQSKRDQPTQPQLNMSSQTVQSQYFPQPSFLNIEHPLTGSQNFPMTHQSPSPSYQCNPIQSVFSPILPGERTTGYHGEYGSEQSDVLPTQLPSFKTKAKNKRQKDHLESTATVTSGLLEAQQTRTLATDISRAIFSPSPDNLLSTN